MPRTALRMPKMSMTMEEGELVGWRIAVGDAVTEGQVVCEVLTDKVDMEVEAPADGTVVGIDVHEGQSVPVGTPIAWIETESDSLMDDLFGAPPVPDAATATATVGAPAVPVDGAPVDGASTADATAAPATANGIVPAIPGARRLAVESGLDLGGLRGTGPTGAIMVSDVRAALAAISTVAATSPVAATFTSPVAATSTVAATSDLAALPAARQAALAPRPGEALAAAGASLWRDAVLGHREPPAAPELLARVAAAVAAALSEAGPAGVRELPRVALLLPTPAGAVPATLIAAHLQSFDVLLAEVTAAMEQARSGMLDVRYLAPPDATVTWIDQVDRVVVPVRPGAVIAIGVGSAARRAVAVGDGIGVRTTVTLSATTDVRLADPSAAAAVLARIVAALEAA